MRVFFLYPIESVWGQVQSGGEVKELDQFLCHEVLLDFVVQDECDQLMINLKLMCKQGYIGDVEFISGHQD
jgi:hypothetical protein